MAGVYGALHDQVSYTISPEYFTKMKFEQFQYANFGWPQRVFASEVGFLASWWVGMIGGWVLARVGLDQLPLQTRGRDVAVAFAIVFVTAIISGCVGALLGFLVSRFSDLSGWNQWRDVLELTDLRSFVIVAYLHWASYLGALLGVIGAAVYVRRRLRQSKRLESEAAPAHPSVIAPRE